MNLLNYTKLLAEKIKQYDKLPRNPFSEKSLANPFATPVKVTLVWIDDENKDDYS